MLKFSPNSKHLAAILSNRTLLVYDFIKEPLFVCLKFKREEIHAKEVHCVAWSFDNQKLATTSSDKLVKIWDNEGTLLTVLKGHNEKVYAAVWNPVSLELYSGGIDNEIIIWNQSFAQVFRLSTYFKFFFFLNLNKKRLGV